MTEPKPDVIDRDGTNATASLLLNDDHAVVGEPDKEGVIDNCELCGAAVGWVQPTSLGPNEYGHSTAWTGNEAREWIAAHPSKEGNIFESSKPGKSTWQLGAEQRAQIVLDSYDTSEQHRLFDLLVDLAAYCEAHGLNTIDGIAALAQTAYNDRKERS